MSKLDEAMNNMLVSLGRIGADVKVAAAYRQGGEDAARALLEYAKVNSFKRIVEYPLETDSVDISELERFFKDDEKLPEGFL